MNTQTQNKQTDTNKHKIEHSKQTTNQHEKNNTRKPNRKHVNEEINQTPTTTTHQIKQRRGQTTTGNNKTQSKQ